MPVFFTSSVAAGRWAGRIVVFWLTLGIITAVTAPVAAQEGEIRALNERLDKLEDSVRSITKYLSNNPESPRGDFQADTGAAAPSGARVADMIVRMQQMEASVRELTGQVEEALHRIDQLNRRLDKLAKDVEFRFQQLEGGGLAQKRQTGQAPPTGADTPAGASQVPAETADTADTAGADAARPGDADTAATDESPPGAAEPLPTGEPAALYDKALGLLRQEDYTGAAQSFQTFLTQFPDHQLAANAQYWLGESYYARGQHQDAARAFLKTYETYPDSNKASGALLKLGLSLAELDQRQDACAALREFDRKFPNADAVAVSRATEARKSLNCP